MRVMHSLLDKASINPETRLKDVTARGNPKSKHE